MQKSTVESYQRVCGSTLSQPFSAPCQKSSPSLPLWCHFWKAQRSHPSAAAAPVTPYCCLCTQHKKQMQPRLYFLRIVPHAFFLVSSLFSQISTSKPSLAALLPLFVKSEIMRQQRVSSYYTALCLSKKTQAAP